MSEKSILLSMNLALTQELSYVTSDLTDSQVAFSAPAIDARSILDVAIHVHRPVLAATAIVTGREWPARPPWPGDHAALQRLLNHMSEQITEWLLGVDDAVLTMPVELRWGKFETGSEALVNSLVHGFVHVGAIRGIRAIGGFPVPPEA